MQVQPGALTKFHDLVVKCLIKLTKGLQASQEVRGLAGLGRPQTLPDPGGWLFTLSPFCVVRLQGVDLGGLLFNIHDFFLFLGVDEIRKRSSSDDKPLRMVKTILHELCKMLVRASRGSDCNLCIACVWLSRLGLASWGRAAWQTAGRTTC